MKTQKIILIIILAIILIAGTTIAILRFSTPEDTWLCQNGQWVKHGQPSQPAPLAACPVANITNNNQIPTNSNQPIQKNTKIIIDKPQADELLTSPYIITGQAAGWYFEGSFPITLLDKNGKTIGQTLAVAQSDWMTSDFVPFKATLDFTIDKDQDASILFEKDNPSDLPQYDESYSLPVKLKAGELKIKIYLGNSEKNPNAQDCTSVYSVERKIAKTTATAKSAIEELLKGVTAEEKNQGYYTTINSGVKLQKITIKDNTAYVDFDEQLEKAVGGSCRVAAIRSQIIQTLKQFSSIKNVVISINGRTEDILQP